jgi:hypothetical protein
MHTICESIAEFLKFEAGGRRTFTLISRVVKSHMFWPSFNDVIRSFVIISSLICSPPRLK